MVRSQAWRWVFSNKCAYVNIILHDNYVRRELCCQYYICGRSQWPRGLRRRSAASRLLGLRVRIPSGTWISVSCECCELSGRGLFDGPIPSPDELYRVVCVCVFLCVAGIKCPVCTKFVLPDDIECHLVMCLTKPRLSYNGIIYFGVCVFLYMRVRSRNLDDEAAWTQVELLWHKKCICELIISWNGTDYLILIWN